jgi:hypothetical protein
VKVYLSMRSVPELSSVPISERGRLGQSVFRKAHLHYWQPWLAVLGIFLLVYIGSGIGGYFGNEKLGIYVGAGIGKLIYLQVGIHFARRYLRDTYFLAEPTLPAKNVIRALLVRA